MLIILDSCKKEQEINLATLTTSEAKEINSNTAISGGNISSTGGGNISRRGVCWSTSPNPTINNNSTSDELGIGDFKSVLIDLLPNTTYHVRAFAVNIKGVSYGNNINFTTKKSIPIIETNTLINISKNTAITGGYISNSGGHDVTHRGVCWSTSPNPTINDSKTSNGIGQGNFTSNLTGLLPNTSYYVRAYAINDIGVAYGNEIKFTTSEYEIGQTGPGGGIVFYDKGSYSDDWRYLEVAPYDHFTILNGNKISLKVEWGCNNEFVSKTSSSIGSGKKNTEIIVSICNGSAASICFNLVSGGKDDWFLPSIDELKLIYENLYLKNKADFRDDFISYWSSTENNSSSASAFPFHGVNIGFSRLKIVKCYVRAIRYF